MTFPRIYFDKTKAKRLVECLKRYRRHINKQTNEAGSALHDEYSHGADAFRYTCIVADSLGNSNGSVAPIKYTRRYIA
jgi:phage terminase large subunit